MLPFDIEVTRFRAKPPRRHSAFNYLAPVKSAAGGATKPAGKTEQKAAAPVPAAKPARSAEPAPAASARLDFSHLRRLAMKHASTDGSTTSLEDTEFTSSDRPRQSSAEVHANDFAAAMEQVMAQAEGRAPRPLLGGPSQEHLEQTMGGDQIVDVLKRRDASRAARRSDRVG